MVEQPIGTRLDPPGILVLRAQTSPRPTIPTAVRMDRLAKMAALVHRETRERSEQQVPGPAVFQQQDMPSRRRVAAEPLERPDRAVAAVVRATLSPLATASAQAVARAVWAA